MRAIEWKIRAEKAQELAAWKANEIIYRKGEAAFKKEVMRLVRSGDSLMTASEINDRAGRKAEEAKERAKLELFEELA